MTHAYDPAQEYDHWLDLHTDDRPVAKQPPAYTDAELERIASEMAGTNLVEEAA